MAKKKMEYDYEKMGSPALKKAVLIDALAMRGTLDGNINEDEISEREEELEKDTEPADLKRELKEAAKKKTAKKTPKKKQKNKKK